MSVYYYEDNGYEEWTCSECGYRVNGNIGFEICPRCYEIKKWNKYKIVSPCSIGDIVFIVFGNPLSKLVRECKVTNISFDLEKNIEPYIEAESIKKYFESNEFGFYPKSIGVTVFQSERLANEAKDEILDKAMK